MMEFLKYFGSFYNIYFFILFYKYLKSWDFFGFFSIDFDLCQTLEQFENVIQARLKFFKFSNYFAIKNSSNIQF